MTKSKNTSKAFVEKLFAHADIYVNGSRPGGKKPWDIEVKDERLYSRLIAGGSLALGESYMDGWWECDELETFIEKIIRGQINKHIPFTAGTALQYAKAFIANQGSKQRSHEIGEKHYDTGNDLFSVMLDKRMVYTCAYWTGKDGQTLHTLDEAQEAKLDLVCRKINLQKGQRILDIGCGWGSFAKFAAEKYGAHVVGITVSKEQVLLAEENCKGLPVEIRLQDYRDVNEKFDHIISLGMFEHVGLKNYKEYMQMANRCLKDDGLFLLHTIGMTRSITLPNPWLDKYIFPGSKLPSVAQISHSFEKFFIMEDWHNFGYDYSKTLCAWYQNFDKHWPQLKEKYGERFYRMWKFYLLSCVGGFRSRECQLWQIVLSKKGVVGGYRSVR